MVNPPPLFGLILGGGRSSRMGRDKAALEYHGKPQLQHTFDLAKTICMEAFVSCRADQAQHPAFDGLPQIHDRFLGFGPMGGILSALLLHREAAFLVLACDLPFLDTSTLAQLVRLRNPEKTATAFLGHENLPEPLCAIYEPRAYAGFLGLMGQGIQCPRKALIRSDILALQPENAGALANVNRPEEFQAAVDGLKTPGPGNRAFA
jgi:molybdenum cofactor guanylyltransferase